MSNPSQASVPTSKALSSKAWTTLLAFAFGLPAAFGIIELFESGPLAGTEYARYVRFSVEKVEIILFCCAVAALLVKLVGSQIEKLAFQQQILPAWDGEPVPAEDAGALRVGVSRLSRWLRGTMLARRTVAILDFVHSRGAVEDLDDQLRTLADNDSIALETSYSLTRFITWAIPILGFLGTVLGISKSISGVTPEVLEKSLSTVTDGLAEAFDTTALALALTMVVMFISFLVERAEQAVLERVDRFADEQLAHRFLRSGGDGAVVVQVVSQTSKALLKATEQLVEKQAAVWSKTLVAAEKQWAEAGQHHQERLTQALETALQRTLDSQGQRVATLESQFLARTTELMERLKKLTASLGDGGREQQTLLGKNLQQLGLLTETLGRIQGDGEQLSRSQQLLAQNLAVVTNTGAFEEALHSLTAAIHLLTARAGLPGTAARVAKPGNAA